MWRYFLLVLNIPATMSLLSGIRNNNTRNMKKYDIVYDILTRECISIKEH